MARSASYRSGHGSRGPGIPRGLTAAALALASSLPLVAQADPCADGVPQYSAGQNGGFNSDLLPGIALGPPRGAGPRSGSLDVVSLGNGGSITLAFRDNWIVDGPGVDFTVFENPFLQNNDSQVFTEAGIVSASEDGNEFHEFPFTIAPLSGVAGLTPVYSAPGNGVDPRDPARSGGDSFDLVTVGLPRARFIRIVDPGAAIPDLGNVFPVPGPGRSGFDLDTVIAVHSQEVCAGCCDSNGDGQVRVNDLVLLLREVLGPASSAPLCGPNPCEARACADANASGELDPGDVVLCLRMALDGTPRCVAGDCDFGD